MDAVLLHFHDNVPLLESKGAKVSFLKYSDWGVSVLGVGVIVNPKTIKESPDLIRRFTRAMAEGYKYAQARPEESVDAVMKRGARGTREAQLKTLLNSFELMQTPNTKGRPLGWMSNKDWESTQELMLLYGGMKKRMPVEEFYANEFIPE